MERDSSVALFCRTNAPAPLWKKGNFGKGKQSGKRGNRERDFETGKTGKGILERERNKRGVLEISFQTIYQSIDHWYDENINPVLPLWFNRAFVSIECS
jgi:hypothetical protein